MLGHSDRPSTERYAKLRNEALVEAIGPRLPVGYKNSKDAPGTSKAREMRQLRVDTQRKFVGVGPLAGLEMVEAAGIETCATATKTSPFQVLTLREAGVRLECSEAGGALLVRGCERVGDHLDVIRGDSPGSSACWNSWPTQRTLGAM